LSDANRSYRSDKPFIETPLAQVLSRLSTAANAPEPVGYGSNLPLRAIGQENEDDRDSRLKNITARTRNYEYVYNWFSDIMETRTTAEWMRQFEQADIPFGPMHDLDSLIDDPHLAAVGLLQEIDHPTEGTLRVAGSPSIWSKTPPSIRQYPPRLGEHGDEILREAGFSLGNIEKLAEGGLIRSDAADHAG
jgi:crotonobetainyl-CoA:carnitine CoA-transferase CaiB-like acyl-CoA transferase